MKDNRDRLTELTLQGYKSIPFEVPLTLHFSDLNILIGSNGSGKSNIISFFRMLGYMANKALQYYVEREGTAQTLLYYGSKRTPSMRARLKFETPQTYDIYEFTLTHAQPDRLIFSSESVEWGRHDHDGEPYTKSLTGDFRETALSHTSDNKTIKTIAAILTQCKAYQFHDSSLDGVLRQSSTVDSAHYLQSSGNNLASFLLYLKENYVASYGRIVEYVRSVVPQFGDFYLEPNTAGYVSLRWRDRNGSDYIFTSGQFSDGSIRFIALATLLLQPVETMPKVIIIDEPELGLHPYAVDVLAEMLKDASTRCQIIAATQSAALIDSFSPEDIIVLDTEAPTYATTARRLSTDELQLWLQEYTLSELWEKNVLGGRPL